MSFPLAIDASLSGVTEGKGDNEPGMIRVSSYTCPCGVASVNQMQLDAGAKCAGCGRDIVGEPALAPGERPVAMDGNVVDPDTWAGVDPDPTPGPGLESTGRIPNPNSLPPYIKGDGQPKPAHHPDAVAAKEWADSQSKDTTSAKSDDVA